MGYSDKEVRVLSDSKVDIKEAFNRMASTHPYTVFTLRKPHFYRRSINRIKLALGTINKSETGFALDVGCGTAYFTYLLSKFYNQVVGVDLSSNMVKIARFSLRQEGLDEKVSFVISDGGHLPFKTSGFNLVLCLDFLHHVPNVPLTVAEMIRVINYNGRVAVFEPNFLYPLYSIFCLILSEESLRYFSRVRHSEISRLLRINNITDITVKESDIFPHLFLVLNPFPRMILKIFELIENTLRGRLAFSFLFSHSIITGRKIY